MKGMLTFLVLVCRHTPNFRGKWRLEAWLEKNKDKYVDHNPVTYRVQGRQFKVDPRTNFHLYMYGPRKNETIVPLIYRYAKPGTATIDVGAHNGYFTICLSDAVGSNGTVHAFEASPVIYAELERTIEINRLHNVQSINKAVSDTTEAIQFYLAPNWKSEVSSMRPGEGSRLTIDATSLDAVMPETKTVSFVKIDVEGAEMKVLKGMSSIISRNHPVMVIEVSDPWLKELGSSSAEVFEFLHANNYQIFEIRKHGHVEIIAPPAKQIDALCIPRRPDQIP